MKTFPKPTGFCVCGCGARTGIAKFTCRSRGWVKGQPLFSLRGHGVRRPGDPVARFWKYVNKTDTCWLWTGAAGRGYGLFRLVPGEPMRRAHRISWVWANGPILDGLYVLHNCPGGDNPRCVNPSHLFLGEQRDNMRDCSQKGRMPRGEQRHAAKLTVDSVRTIRALKASGRRIQSLAREFGVSGPTVRKIVLRQSWAWVA